MEINYSEIKHEDWREEYRRMKKNLLQARDGGESLVLTVNVPDVDDYFMCRAMELADRVDLVSGERSRTVKDRGRVLPL